MTILVAPPYTALEAMMAELYTAFPQRYVLGIPSKEDTLGTYNGMGGATTTVTRADRNHSVVTVQGISGGTQRSAVMGTEDHAKLAGDLLRATKGMFDGPYRYVENGKTTVEVGNAKVYEALNEGEAQRNLNFAIANLQSYIRWIEKGRAEKEKRDAELKAAEERKRKEEEKRQREIEEAKRRVEAEKKRTDNAALALYNASNGRTSYAPWPPFMGAVQKEKWLNLARQADTIKRAENPWGISPSDMIIGSISANTIRASDIYPPSYANSARPFGF